MDRVEKTVFVSYRRHDFAWALSVYQWLTSQGYDVFFDYEGLGSGAFESAIVGNILARAHFLVLLSPTSLDRCGEPGDWLRREIEEAMDASRNIVPVMLDGFSFSAPTIKEKLTGKLAALSEYNGLEVHRSSVPEAMERLSRRFLNVTLEGVLHPPSVRALQLAKVQKEAANAAIAGSDPPLGGTQGQAFEVALQLLKTLEGKTAPRMASPASPRTTEGDSAHSHPLLREMARLGGHCAGYLADLAAARGGWEVHYALDADVVAMYLDPEAHAHYGNVFGGDTDPETSRLLARLMGDFLLREFSGVATRRGAVGTLFVVPPHTEEITQILVSISTRLQSAIQQARPGLKRALDLLSERLPRSVDPAEVASSLIEIAPVLIELLDGDTGLRAQIDRLRMVGRNRLVPLNRSSPEHGGRTFPLPQLDGEGQDSSRFSALVDAWEERLLHHRGSQRRYAVSRDAHVLATVQWVNEEMASHKVRLVLVTGTPGILASGAEVEVREPDTTDAGATTFADVYLRHPQAFLAHSNFFRHAQHNSTEDGTVDFRVVEWMNLVFSDLVHRNLEGSVLFGRDRLEPADKSATATDDLEGAIAPEQMESMVSEWRTQVRATSVARELYRFATEKSERALDLLAWLQDRSRMACTFDEMLFEITGRSKESLSKLYSSSIVFGLWSQAEHMERRMRPVPPLRLGGTKYERVQKYYTDAVNAKRSDEDASRTSRTEFDLEAMYEELAEPDSDRPFAHLIHALVYARRGQWFATRTLCRVALSTLDGAQQPGGGELSGREARYLLAVAERKTARTSADLDRAHAILIDARRREEVGGPPDLRFACEEFSIDVGRTILRMLASPSDAASAALAHALHTGSGLLGQACQEEPDGVRDWTSQQVLTGMLCLALLAASQELLPSELVDRIRGVLAGISEDANQLKAMQSDEIAHLVLMVANAVFSADASTRRASREVAATLRPASIHTAEETLIHTLRNAAERDMS